MTDARSWDFFICHATANLVVATQLHSLLVPGSRAYLGHVNLGPGERFDLALPAAQAESRFTVVMVGSRDCAAHFANSEIQRGIQLERDWSDGRSTRSHEVIPVWLDGRRSATEVPYGLEMKSGLDLSILGLEETARRLIGVANGVPERESKSMTPAPAQADDLAAYPRTRVPASLIPPALIREFAQITHRDLYNKAAEIIVRAADMRRQADPLDPCVTVLTETEAYMHNATAEQYWNHALRCAGIHGGRMFAAVLMAVPDDNFSREGLRIKRQILHMLREEYARRDNAH